MHTHKQAVSWDIGRTAFFCMQKQRSATALFTETAEADTEIGAPKFLPFVQQVTHLKAQHR